VLRRRSWPSSSSAWVCQRVLIGGGVAPEAGWLSVEVAHQVVDVAVLPSSGLVEQRVAEVALRRGRGLCCWRGVRQSGRVPRGGAKQWLAWVRAGVRPVLAWSRCGDAEICFGDCCRCLCGVY
jgi:hypothetical protein